MIKKKKDKNAPDVNVSFDLWHRHAPIVAPNVYVEIDAPGGVKDWGHTNARTPVKYIEHFGFLSVAFVTLDRRKARLNK